VIDLHEPQFPNAKFERPEFWNRKDLADTFCRVWTEIAIRLLPYKESIWGYDLCSEPLDRTLFPGLVCHEWKEVDSSFQCCIKDGSRPAAYAVQTGYANHLKELQSKVAVLNVQAKGVCKCIRYV
jgi:hypothetical protein